MKATLGLAFIIYKMKYNDKEFMEREIKIKTKVK